MIDNNNKNKRPRYLPSEVWADVFSLIRRDEWACPDRRGPNLVNRRFSALAHARLHERGALLLRLGSKFWITFYEAFPKAIRDYKEMPLPYAPLPKNIVGLEQPTEILLSYLDHRVLVLLSNALLPLLKRHQFCAGYPVLSNPTGNGHNNSICVQLDDCDFWDFIDANLNALAIERVLSPLCKTDGDCTTTYILTITHRMLISPQVQAVLLQQLEVIQTVFVQAREDLLGEVNDDRVARFLLNWLHHHQTAVNNDGGGNEASLSPKFLFFIFEDHTNIYRQFINEIQERFLAATTSPVSFTISIHIWPEVTVEALLSSLFPAALYNSHTNEQLWMTNTKTDCLAIHRRTIPKSGHDYQQQPMIIDGWLERYTDKINSSSCLRFEIDRIG
ncbi:hypothetical protein GPALN_003108 [Globodera pallida]|nr:hypothetical protein GPALN_003108 [Globodera pallida]